VTKYSHAVIVGTADDPHVQAVVGALGSHGAVVLDVARLGDIGFTIAPTSVNLNIDGEEIDLSTGWRGWIRRLSPIAWEHGVTIGSHEAAVKSAWLSLLAALLRHPSATWLSDLDPINSSENKLTQYAAAQELSVCVPATVASNQLAHVVACGNELIAKPLGPGHFRTDDGQWLTVFTESFDLDADAHLLSGTPFLVQQHKRAVAHKRVVTVADRAWVFRLDAAGLPIDWRVEPRAHRDWHSSIDDETARQALSIARRLGLGYSSQDWIETASEHWFLDLNPAGQWLFLPDPGADQITRAIADWLRER
jgi:hypothetical protein